MLFLSLLLFFQHFYGKKTAVAEELKIYNFEKKNIFWHATTNLLEKVILCTSTKQKQKEHSQKSNKNRICFCFTGIHIELECHIKSRFRKNAIFHAENIRYISATIYLEKKSQYFIFHKNVRVAKITHVTYGIQVTSFITINHSLSNFFAHLRPAS